VSDDNLAVRLEQVEARLVAAEREIAVKDRVIIDQLERIGRLKVELEDARQRGERQLAPFSKGKSQTEARTPGR